MAQRPKPKHRSGYSAEETELVKAACLTAAAALGAYMDRLCIVGGLAPFLLIDNEIGPDPETGDTHPGTNDLDVGLEIALLDDEQYRQVSAHLRQAGFEPDKNDEGNATPQRWTFGGLDITIDFLIAPLPGAERGGSVQPLEGDFGALITPGLQLAPDERIEVTLKGKTLKAEAIERDLPVCGPGVFVLLKSLAFADRGEEKDAYDLTYVLHRWPGGIANIAERVAGHATRHKEVVIGALGSLARDFRAPENHGPQRAAAFVGEEGENQEAAAADAHGYVDDFLKACEKQGLQLPTSD